MNSSKTIGNLSLFLSLAIFFFLLGSMLFGSLLLPGFLLGVVIFVIPFSGLGIYLLRSGMTEESEDKKVKKEKRILNMVEAKGSIRISDILLDLKITRKDLENYLYDLVGKELFTGYVDWNQGMLYSKDASLMEKNKCPNCGGTLELGGKGVVKCPYCGTTIFLKKET